jgi:phosphoesterase RecJ-like protein
MKADQSISTPQTLDHVMEIRDSEFGSCISRYNDVLYLCHRNADPDAIGSGFALQQAFGGTLGAAEDLSKAGSSLAAAIGAEIILNPRVEKHDFVVVVDASVGRQLGNVRLTMYAVVDHHLDDGLLAGAQFHIQRPSSSTAEIVWSIIKKSQVVPIRETVLGLLVGMISDTGRFRRASPQSLRAAAEMLETGLADYDEAVAVLSRMPTEISQRIAVLKAASRAEVIRQDDWLIATTEINAFEGSAAMGLVDIGADVALAAGLHGSSTRVSGRASREAARAGLDLSGVMRQVAKGHGGEGGGHRAAAALEATGAPLLLLAECKEKVAEKLRPKQI